MSSDGVPLKCKITTSLVPSCANVIHQNKHNKSKSHFVQRADWWLIGSLQLLFCVRMQFHMGLHNSPTQFNKGVFVLTLLFLLSTMST